MVDSKCPECGSKNLAFGPPDAKGGERYHIDTHYCPCCGYVYDVVQWTEKSGVRIATLEKVEGGAK